MNKINLVKKTYEELQDEVIKLTTGKFLLKSRIDKAIEYLYKHSQYNDGDGVHYIKEDEYCVDY